MTAATDRGLDRFGRSLRREDLQHPIYRNLMDALADELALLREQNDHPTDIAKTTMTRGQISLVKRILALADEVGPESVARRAQSPHAQSQRPPAAGI